MNVFDKSLAALDSVLNNIPNQDLLELSKKFRNHNFNGITVEDYFSRKCNPEYKFLIGIDSIIYTPPPNQYIFDFIQINNPEISRGVLFYVTSQYERSN